MLHSCIGLGSGIGAATPGAGDAPQFLKDHLSLDNLKWEKIITPPDVIKDKCNAIAEMNTQLAKQAYKQAKEGFFFSFGGDHSTAIGTWSGVAEAFRDKGDIGLIWLDAHMDAHTFETTETGNVHGMPVAVLLGYGDPRLTSILSDRPKIKPENMILIGIRSYEKGELELLKKLNVRVYYIEEVLERGLEVILTEAIESLKSRTVGYGVSFDLDVIDPAYVQGTGTKVPNGVDLDDIAIAIDIFTKTPPLAFELVEYNPHLDKDSTTLQITCNIVKSMLKIEKTS